MKEGKEAAWGVGRHDGAVRRSIMEVWEGKDNYLAELAALVEALAQEADGERVSILFDATSPVLALGRWWCRRASQMGFGRDCWRNVFCQGWVSRDCAAERRGRVLTAGRRPFVST